MDLLLAILAFWLIYTLVRFLWRVRRTYNSFRNQFGQAMGATGFASSSSGSKASVHKHPEPRRHRKIIPHEYGEYIDFEETVITGKEVFMHTASIDYRMYRGESQISDVKWVEIR